MAKYRFRLPQLDSGLFPDRWRYRNEPHLHDKLELPYFAAFHLLKDASGRAALHKYGPVSDIPINSNSVGSARKPPVAYSVVPDPDQNGALPAECLVLVFEPGECVFKMLRIKIRPIFIPEIQIRISRLHREKTAQSASSSPTYNQIQT